MSIQSEIEETNCLSLEGEGGKMEIRMNALLKLFDKLIRASQETFTIEEAAEYLKVENHTVRYYAKRLRELPYAKVGRKLVFLKKDLDRFLEKKKCVWSSWQK